MKKILLLFLLITSSVILKAQEIKLDQSDLYVGDVKVGYLHKATRIINKEDPSSSYFYYVFVLEKEIDKSVKKTITEKTKRKKVNTKIEFVELYRFYKVRTTVTYTVAQI